MAALCFTNSNGIGTDKSEIVVDAVGAALDTLSLLATIVVKIACTKVFFADLRLTVLRRSCISCSGTLRHESWKG